MEDEVVLWFYVLDAGIISFFYCYQIVYFRFFGRFLDLECMFVPKIFSSYALWTYCRIVGLRVWLFVIDGFGHVREENSGD